MRRAAVRRIGTLAGRNGNDRRWQLDPDDDAMDVLLSGANVVVRSPGDGAGFRAGIGRCVDRRLNLDGIAGPAEGDIVYLVEPA